MTVSGVVKSVNAEFASGRMNKRAKASGLYLVYLEANSLTNSRQVCLFVYFRVCVSIFANGVNQLGSSRFYRCPISSFKGFTLPT